MKNKLFKPVMAVALAGIVALGSIVPFSATVNETQTASESGNKEAEVVYTQDSNFIVTIPKKITLDETKSSTYNVNVIGDIASDEKVTVVPDASFLMKDQATVGTLKEDVSATVTQDKTEWTNPEIAVEGGSTTDGSVSAPDLTAGNWKGTFNFNIKLKEIVHISSGKAGMYDSNGIQTYSWQELLDNGYLYVNDTGVLTNAENESVRKRNNTDIFDGTLIIDNSVTEIGKYTFYCQENLTTIVIPDNVVKIGTEAFYCCDLSNDEKPLSTVYIGSGVETIGHFAFVGDNIENVYYAGTEENWNNIIIFDFSWQQPESTLGENLSSAFETRNGNEIIYHYNTSYQSNN